MSGTDAAGVLCTPYELSGTEVAYRATHCAVLRQRMVLLACRRSPWSRARSFLRSFSSLDS
eukprot:100175-Rhodomonas_salina.1